MVGEKVGYNCINERIQKDRQTALLSSKGGAAPLICEHHKEPTHLPITDVVMPETSWREPTDRLSRLRREMKGLFVSGYTDDSRVRQAVLGEGGEIHLRAARP